MHTKTLRLAMRGILPILASLLLLGRTTAQTYCAATASVPYSVCNVSFADMDAPNSNQDAGYLDYTGTVATVSPALSYPLSVRHNHGFDFQITAYFDWDDNGSFETSVPLGAVVTSCASAPVVTTVAVPANATEGNSRMRIVSNYFTGGSACGTFDYGQVLDYTIAVGPPPTCLPPSGLLVTNVTATTADLSWTASTSSPSAGYQWEVRASGTPGSGSPAASGTAGGSTATATGLTGAISTYRLYVRSDCGGGDLSSWVSSGAFETFTPVSCGSVWVSPGGATSLTSERFIRTYTITPTTPGDLATINFAPAFDFTWNDSQVNQASAMFIYDGDNTSAPLIAGTGTGYSCNNTTIFCPGGQQPWSVPAGGWITRPPPITSTAASGALTIKVYSYGVWTGNGQGWSANVSCAPLPTCFVPTNLVVTGTTPQTASFSWNAGASPNVEYKVVANGGTAASAAITSGTSTNGTATTAAVLVPNTHYTVFFRGLCDGGNDPSAWSDPGLNFRTRVGCNGSYAFTSQFSASTLAPKDTVVTFCPDNVGDVLTLNFSTFAPDGSSNLHMYVYDGPNISATLIHSGQTTAPSGGPFPVGGYRIAGSATVFTSTHSSGCLTLRFGATTGTFNPPYPNIQASATCGPAPACATPSGVTVTPIGGTTATVNWTGAGAGRIIEYGPAGFTPGTGADAGTNGTVVSNVATGYTLTGLTVTTTYDVYVRLVCSGPSYSANSFRTRFTTSMDCALAQVITCAEMVANPFTGATGNSAYTTGSYSGTCLSGAFGQASATGVERLYRFTAPETGNYQLAAAANGASDRVGYMIAPVSAGCGASAFSCIGTINNAGGALALNALSAGDYYIIADAHTSVVAPQPFQVFCPGVPPCLNGPTFPPNNSTIANNSTAIAFSWPAAFGATSYDVYFNGTYVTNTTQTSISSSAYNPAAVVALVGIGNPVTWNIVPRNATGPAVCPTPFTFRVGGNGTANAIPLLPNETRTGTNRTTHGYTSTYSTLVASTFFGNVFTTGNDVTYIFTTSACDSVVTVLYCQQASEGGNNPVIVIRPVSNPSTEVAKVITGGVNPNTCRTLTAVVDPSTAYYITVDAQTGHFFNFTVSYSTVVSTADSDDDGTIDCLDECPFDPDKIAEGQCGCFNPEPGAVCDDGDPTTVVDRITADCICAGQPCTQDLVIDFDTDANGGEVSWEIVPEDDDEVLCGGIGLPDMATDLMMPCCLPEGCFRLRVMDSAGDGMASGANGGYILRMSGSHARIIDNENNFLDGSLSGQSFCLPIGTDRPIFTSCDKLDWTNNQFLVASLNPAVTADWVNGAPHSAQDPTSGYEFWFFDPNGDYSHRVFKSLANATGAGTTYARAAHLLINGWASANHIPQNLLMNVRVRSRVNGTNAEWGPACRFKLDAVAAACPKTQLLNIPGNAYYSCDSHRFWATNQAAHANPVSGASQYEFRFRQPAENVTVIRSSTTYFVRLGWAPSTGTVLQPGTYDVDVRAFKNGGWCEWGPVCKFTICTTGTTCPPVGEPQMLMAPDATTTTFGIWPNPNRGDQLNISLDQVGEEVLTVSVDIFDMYGKKVLARTLAVNDGFLNTVIDLNNEIASGLYLVNITAGDKVHTTRLVVQQ